MLTHATRFDGVCTSMLSYDDVFDSAGDAGVICDVGTSAVCDVDVIRDGADVAVINDVVDIGTTGGGMRCDNDVCAVREGGDVVLLGDVCELGELRDHGVVVDAVDVGAMDNSRDAGVIGEAGETLDLGVIGDVGDLDENINVSDVGDFGTIGNGREGGAIREGGDFGVTVDVFDVDDVGTIGNGRDGGAIRDVSVSDDVNVADVDVNRDGRDCGLVGAIRDVDVNCDGDDLGVIGGVVDLGVTGGVGVTGDDGNDDDNCDESFFLHFLGGATGLLPAMVDVAADCTDITI